MVLRINTESSPRHPYPSHLSIRVSLSPSLRRMFGRKSFHRRWADASKVSVSQEVVVVLVETLEVVLREESGQSFQEVFQYSSPANKRPLLLSFINMEIGF